MSTRADHRVYKQVKRKVVLAQIPAGEAINIKMLREELSSSQVPIREALIRLAAENLVDFLPGRGYFAKSHDLAEIIGNFDLLIFFLTDAATYIASTESRRQHLASIMQKTSLDSGLRNDLFDSVQTFDEIVSHLYRRPHSELLARALYRCAYLLHVDAVLNGDDLIKGTHDYLTMIQQNHVEAIHQEVLRFWSERKRRLPETMAFAANMDPIL